MKYLLKFFINNSLLVNFLTIFILLSGTLILFNMKQEARPPVNLNKLYVSTLYRGASPEDVEKLVTIPIEDEIVKVNGIKKLISTSYFALSRIYVEIDPDRKDAEKIISDVYRAIDRVSNLPSDSEKPSVYEVTTDSFPVLSISIYSDNDDTEYLYEAVDYIERKLDNLKEVSDAQISGRRDPVIELIVNPKKLNEEDISVAEVINAVKLYSLTGPAGRIVSKKQDTTIRIDNELDTKSELKNLVLRVTELGDKIRVKRVANVKDGYNNDHTVIRADGHLAVFVSILKSSQSDTVHTAKATRDLIKKLIKKFPGIHYKILWDDSFYVRDTLKFTRQNAVLGFFLMLIILFWGLDNFRISSVTALGLPVAFLGSIIVVFLLGYSLNMMTLIGFILVIGMLVDDGIVVAENIHHFMEQGMPVKEAAVKGAYSVFWPVIGAVSTTIVAFLPLLFMKGIIGKFMAIVPVVVISALAISMLECFFILPNHFTDILKLTKGRKKTSTRRSSLLKIENAYKKLLSKLMKRRGYVLLGTLLLFTIIGVLSYKTIKIELFSVKGVPSFSIYLHGKSNIPIEETVEANAKIEKILDKYKPKYVKSYYTQVGTVIRHSGAFMDVGNNYSSITVYFPDLNEREFSEKETISVVQNEIKKLDLKDFTVSYDIFKNGPPSGKPVDISLSGASPEVVNKAAEELVDYLQKQDGIYAVETTASNKQKEYVLKIKEDVAQELGVSGQTIQLLTMSAFDGVKITSIRKGFYDCEIRVVYPLKYRDNIGNLLHLKVPTRYGTNVPLSKLVNVQKLDTPNNIIRDFREQIQTVSAEIGDNLSTMQANKIAAIYEKTLLDKYPGLIIKHLGQDQEQRDTVLDVGKLFVIAIIAIFMIIALILSSMRYTLFILMAIPFGIMGALLALIIHNNPLSLPVMISLVGLTGVVVNDAILLVKTILDKIRDGETVNNAIEHGAVRRLRPIMLTSLTTLAGLLPAAYELMGANDFMQQMSLVMAWGLLFATTLTLIAIPPIMSYFHKLLAGAKTNKKESIDI